MEFLNLHASILDSPEVVGAEPIDRGTWLMLLRYCAGQENGGKILDCRTWKDRKWQQLARVTLAEVNRSSDLWTWHGEDLSVLHYPLEQESIVRLKRETARTNGRAGGRHKKNPAETNVGSLSVPKTQPKPNPAGKRKEREGKERELEEEEEARAGEALELIPDAAAQLVACYAKPAATRPALEAASHCLRRHAADPAAFASILTGTKLAANCLRAWPPDEFLAYCPSAETFFHNDLWRRTAEDWTSRREARKRLASDKQAPAVDIGGRRPVVLDTSKPPAPTTETPEPDFAAP